MSARTVSSKPMCVHPGCDKPGIDRFMSHLDDWRCLEHHKVEEARRIAAIDAAIGVFKALVG